MLDHSHNVFAPPSSNCTLWRYMDLAKLLSLLESRTLYFPRADQFPDPYEGALSRATIEALGRWKPESQGLPADTVQFILENAKRQRSEMFISCWTASEYESAAMWKLYLQSPEGVAIKTDYDSLAKVLDGSPQVIYTTMVQYIDYDKTIIEANNAFFPFIHKRMSFAHEKELRAIIWGAEGANKPYIDPTGKSIAISINPEELIKAIHVSPAAPKWYGELVDKLLRRYAMATTVVHSSLYERPTY